MTTRIKKSSLMKCIKGTSCPHCGETAVTYGINLHLTFICGYSGWDAVKERTPCMTSAHYAHLIDDDTVIPEPQEP